MKSRGTKQSWIEAAVIAMVLAMGACGGGGGYDSPTAPPVARTVTVDVVDFSFSPRSVTIQPGDSVRWVMRGSDPGHTVTALNGAFDSGLVFNAANATFTRTFPAAEAGRTFEYRCLSHTDCCAMQGSVRVGDAAPAPNPGY